MMGMGTLINAAAIAAGGLLGAVFGRVLKENVQDTLTRACGIATLFLGLAGALEGMLKVSGNQLESSGAMLVVGCLALGGLVGELLGIEAGFERFGVFLREKTGVTAGNLSVQLNNNPLNPKPLFLKTGLKPAARHPMHPLHLMYPTRHFRPLRCPKRRG